jgi:D-arabinose 1-dehydrogenase-like Zn-dependent alcohol dehydrogenase
MLQFAAFHGIKPIIQKFALNVQGIEEAMQRLENGQIRYKAVLIAQD